MSQLVTLSRAARLVGVSRAALQKRIRSGELSTFEGRLEVVELLRIYPQTQMEEDAMLERMEQIMEHAVNKVVWRKTEIPEAEVLAERVATLHAELSYAKSAMNRQLAFVDEIEHRLSELTSQASMGQQLKDFHSWFIQSRRERVQPVILPDYFMTRDAFLRIMAADIKVLPSGHEFLVEGRDSILDAALFSGCNLNYGCSDGSCGLCTARVVSGKVKEVQPPNFRLSKEERDAGLILMCCNTAVTDLVIQAEVATRAEEIPLQIISARVKTIEEVGEDTWVVHLRTPRNKRLRFLAGQFATLQVGNNGAYDLPIASCPCHETHLEFHISKSKGRKLHADLLAAKKNTDPVVIEAPKGGFILQEDSPKPIICIAWDNGFAPIKSLIEHAMALDITESIHLYWITARAGGHYMQNLCRSWTDALDEFKFTPIAANTSRGTNAEWEKLPEDLVESQLIRVKQDYPDLSDFNIYIVGPNKVVATAEKLFPNLGLPAGQLFGAQLV